MTSGISWKIQKKFYPTKTDFIIHWLIFQLLIKFMNMFWTFRKLLKSKLWKVVIICTQNIYVILLETFRKESINFFKLDPAHNLSTSGYSCDAIVGYIDMSLNLILDDKKYQFIESMTRVDISMICKGFVEVNDKLLKSCVASKATSHITHRENIFSLNVRGTFPWYNPRIFVKCSLWNSGDHSQIMFRE